MYIDVKGITVVNEKEKTLFIFGDGDKIREALEGYLFAEEFEKVKKLSENLTEAILHIRKRVETELGGEIIIAGGDDILFVVKTEDFNQKTLIAIAQEFHESTGNTISFGIGHNIERAYLNLRRAKTSKNEKICFVGVKI